MSLIYVAASAVAVLVATWVLLGYLAERQLGSWRREREQEKRKRRTRSYDEEPLIGFLDEGDE